MTASAEQRFDGLAHYAYSICLPVFRFFPCHLSATMPIVSDKFSSLKIAAKLGSLIYR